jgi:hypothetical protein
MTKKILDAETQANYTVGISVTDGTRYDYAIILLHIIPLFCFLSGSDLPLTGKM